MIRFYFKKGKWHVTSDKKAVPANLWWAAINEVKCMNHKIRQARVSTYTTNYVTSYTGSRGASCATSTQPK